MYIHTSMYIIERIDERLAYMKGAEMTDKDFFARMAQSIIDGNKNDAQALAKEAIDAQMNLSEGVEYRNTNLGYAENAMTAVRAAKTLVNK
jgi:hypothetical protein